jgi:putative NIF3 family GTP cyclohydrolase 1 type 2
MTVTGIATTMFPTVEVIRKAVRARTNFIIAHEPVFYNHRDQKDIAGTNEMINAKAALLDDNQIVLWRLHDYWHSVNPDGIMKGLLDRLQWTNLAKEDGTIMLPAQSLQTLITDVKAKLKLKGLRFIGNPTDSVSRVCLMPGASGGRHQIETIQRVKPDLVVCGEISEWETGEYIRDLRAMGTRIALVILGHTPSEEPGMKWLQTWLKPRLPGLPIEFIPAGDPYSFA